ncbi:adenylate/guanylate cyclase domain-containing protein [Aequorivita todarodis]|uniref:adenylate/guanylate cyclase domain-containing protein n=1 Tax=Aequorivita todarodis TaxID=2036821 RepID=UPI00234FDC30|nr:adenylate/guanylate cyclase domain-containing protein [Aequorivita todarodis]MDC8000808.1 adenylate/guanylate cyclase domain-containing protein [Aequorivita todarodis]
MKESQKKTILLLFSIFSLCLNAQKNLDSLYGVWQDKTQADSSRIKALKDYIWEGYLFSQPDTALILIEKLYQFSNKKENLIGIAGATDLKGAFYDNHGMSAKALDYYQSGLKIRKKINDARGIAVSLNHIGNLYLIQENFIKALEYYQKALEIQEQHKYKNGVNFSLTNIGIVYSRLEDYSKALDFLQRGLDIHEEIGDLYGIAITSGNIGDVYRFQGNYIKAMTYYETSLKSFEKIGYKTGIAISLSIMAIIQIDQGDYKKAIEACQKSLDLALEIGAIHEQKEACACLYETYKKLGNGTKALEFHEQMLVLNDSLQSEETSKKLQQMEFAKQVLADSLAQVEKDLKIEMAHQNEVRKKDKNRNIAIGVGIFFLLAAGGFYSRWHYVKKSKAVIEKEKNRSENLLLNILPSEIAEELKAKGSADARDFDMVSILFTDFKGFTQASEKLTAKELIEEINVCFKAFDHICEKHGIEKIKTIGDAYMAAGGLPIPSDNSTKNTVLAGLEMQAFISDRIGEKNKLNEMSFKMRLGIHTGPVVAGIVGVKKFQYDIWGDTVNIASRMESSGEIGKVNISEGTYELLKNDPDLIFTSRGRIEAKGKGEIEMFFVTKR